MSARTGQSRVQAAFLCMAVTDALGAPLEFGPRISDLSKHVTTMKANRNFNLPPGHFTDDTSMALCLAFSLLETQAKADAASQAQAYLRWFREGCMSSLPGKCFDIGLQTAQTLETWEKIMRISPGQTASRPLSVIRTQFSGDRCCGNGSLMRVLPCALVASTEEQAIELAHESSIVTHPHPRCIDACTIYSSLVFRALQGSSKVDLISRLVEWTNTPTSNSIDKVLRQRLERYKSTGDFEQQVEVNISSSGYVVDTLEAALWVFFTTDDYQSGAIRVVNLGDDADTVGAVYGGLAGAYYGHEDIIPKKWLDSMQGLRIVRGVVDRIVHKFHTLS